MYQALSLFNECTGKIHFRGKQYYKVEKDHLYLK